MAKNRIRKGIRFEKKRQERIKELREELIKNDEILKKNKENHTIQVQMGLWKKGYPQSSPMYDTLIEKMEYDIKEFKIKLDSGFNVVNPTFAFQQDPRWIDMQIEIHKKMLKATEDNIAEIRKNMGEVENDIIAQNERIKERRTQIIEELGELGEDISEIKEKSPDYIR